MRTTARFGSTIPLPKTNNRQHILIIPGFMATDGSTARLRRSLNLAGHQAYGWGLGRNRGVTEDVLQMLHEQVERIQPNSRHKEKVIIIGWSLGGLLAREYAKFAPDKVRQVITLGSPFSGDIRGNNAWRAYELVAQHSVDAPPIDADLKEKPPVPTYAFWSRQDGVVSPASARGSHGETDGSFELDCTHMAFVSKPTAITAIADIINRH